MIYLKSLHLPTDAAEIGVIQGESRTCFGTFYPFKIFPQKRLSRLDFDSVTMLYGGNGSGKSTLVNVIAELTGAVRYSDFNDAPFFSRYVKLCRAEYMRRPPAATVLTSDDVFDYALSARAVNGKIDEQREELIEKYVRIRGEAIDNPEIGLLHGLDDYERWRETRDILSRRKTQSQFVKQRTARDVDLYSNGETSMRYFLDRIEEDGLYLLDEPENSLSPERQEELRDYIAATVRTSLAHTALNARSGGVGP